MVSSLNEKIKEFLLCLFVLSKGDGVLVVEKEKIQPANLILYWFLG